MRDYICCVKKLSIGCKPGERYNDDQLYSRSATGLHHKAVHNGIIVCGTKDWKALAALAIDTEESLDLLKNGEG
eukprot:c3043_g2_i1 orf=153-374(+)